jgi:hypothetical protein
MPPLSLRGTLPTDIRRATHSARRAVIERVTQTISSAWVARNADKQFEFAARPSELYPAIESRRPFPVRVKGLIHRPVPPTGPPMSHPRPSRPAQVSRPAHFVTTRQPPPGLTCRG